VVGAGQIALVGGASQEWHTLIAGDWSRYAREVNPQGNTVWEFTQADVPEEKLGNIQTASRLANGNTVMCCWIAGTARLALAGYSPTVRSESGKESGLGAIFLEQS